MDQIDDRIASPGRQMTYEQALAALRSWEAWWQEHGSGWYEGIDCPQAHKPPVLVSSSPVFGFWATGAEVVYGDWIEGVGDAGA
jgi:hypothetical protein